MRFVSPEAVTGQIRGRTVVSCFCDTVAERSERTALRWREGEQWRELTWKEYADLACRVAAALASLGVERGDRVTLMLRNRPEFHITDMAALLLGATPTSLYNTSSTKQVDYQLRHAESRVAVVDRPDALEKVLAVRDNVESLHHVLCVDDIGDLEDSDVRAFDELLAHEPVSLTETAKNVTPEDLATIIYTSGTTGPPKGVMISHYNVVWAVEAKRLLWGKDFVGKRVVSYLPMAHVAERMISHWVAAVAGFEVTSCPEPEQLRQYLSDVHPQLLFCPPRFWEKLYEAMRDMAGAGEFDRVVAARKAVDEARLKGTDPSAADTAVCQELEPKVSEWKAALALDALEIAYSASAPGNPDVLDAFAALGTPLSEGYAMSETTACGTADVYEPRRGTVGRPDPGLELELADDGEVLVRGGCVMVGYLKDSEKTDEAIDSEQWLHTGDIGEMDDDRYLRIVDRKKDVIINAYGKNMSPANVEAELQSNPLFSHAVAVGDGRKFISALFVLDPEVAPSWAEERNISFDELDDLAAHPEALKEAEQTVNQANEMLSKVEQVRRFRVLPGPWLPDSAELTALAKIKRGEIAADYSDEIEEMYASEPPEGVGVIAAD